jgi:biotin-(acetyl-CoA carboxylase) ligase
LPTAAEPPADAAADDEEEEEDPRPRPTKPLARSAAWARWLARAAHLGKPVRIRQQQGTLEGTFLDIDSDGRLMVQTAKGLVLVDAGDVFPLDK